MSETIIASATHDARGAKVSLEDLTRCEILLSQWMDALNRHDVEAMETCMRFPHVRVAAGTVVVYPAAGSDPMDLFARLVERDDWHHSAWTDLQVLQSSPNKVHYAVQYARYRADGSTIGIYDSLYVLTLLEGDWRLQCRSSFGP